MEETPGPHDGTSTEEQAVDNFVSSSSGRIVVASAGNNGEDSIHITGSLAKGSTKDFNFYVDSYSPRTGSEMMILHLISGLIKPEL